MKFFKRDKLKGIFNDISSQRGNLLDYAAMAVFYGATMGGPIGSTAGYILATIFVFSYCLPHTYARLKKFGSRFKRAA